MHSLVRTVALATAISLTTIAPAHAGLAAANAVLAAVLGAYHRLVIIRRQPGRARWAALGGGRRLRRGDSARAAASSYHRHGYYVATATAL